MDDILKRITDLLYDNNVRCDIGIESLAQDICSEISPAHNDIDFVALEETILSYKQIINENIYNRDDYLTMSDYNAANKCQEIVDKYNQLVGWLEELKRAKEEPFENIREFCNRQQGCDSCIKYSECKAILNNGLR